MNEWLGAFVDHCVVKLLGGIMQCRVARHCRSLGGSLEAMNTGLTVKLLVGVDKLFGGTKQAVASCSDCKGLGL